MQDAIATARPLVLASNSPRRRAFLTALGVPFEALATDIDETPLHDEDPRQLAMRLADTKADEAVRLCAQTGRPVGLIVASDTVVMLDGQQLGKPVDRSDARRMLTTLRGRDHSVLTALCVLDVQTGVRRRAQNESIVTMRPYTDDEIEAYIDTGDPFDKAGGYAIQHPTFRPVSAMRGCLASVMGFPLRDLRDLLSEFGVEISRPLPEVCEVHAEHVCCARESGSDAGVEYAASPL